MAMMVVAEHAGNVAKTSRRWAIHRPKLHPKLSSWRAVTTDVAALWDLRGRDELHQRRLPPDLHLDRCSRLTWNCSGRAHSRA